MTEKWIGVMLPQAKDTKDCSKHQKPEEGRRPGLILPESIHPACLVSRTETALFVALTTQLVLPQRAVLENEHSWHVVAFWHGRCAQRK